MSGEADPGAMLLPPPLTEAPNPSVPQQGVHLYHHGPSLYSRVVRIGLHEAGLQYTSHKVVLPLNMQYEAGYVRINERAVVPTLVIDGKVTTDAINILQLLDERYGDWASYAVPEMEAIRRQCARIEAMPWMMVTYGTYPPGVVEKPSSFHRMMQNNTPALKLEPLRRLYERHKTNPQLSKIYAAKIAGREAAMAKLNDEAGMREALAKTEQAVGQLENDLSKGPFKGGGWLCSQRFSRADIVWMSGLHRLQELGLLDIFTEARPACRAYFRRLCMRPSYKLAIAAWDAPCAVMSTMCTMLAARWLKCTPKVV